MKTEAKNNDAASNKPGKHEHSLPQEISTPEKAAAIAAHEEAEHDMEEDPDFSMHSPNDDLDEGETARLGNDENPLI